jgi:hypothetical protein
MEAIEEKFAHLTSDSPREDLEEYLIQLTGCSIPVHRANLDDLEKACGVRDLDTMAECSTTMAEDLQRASSAIFMHMMIFHRDRIMERLAARIANVTNGRKDSGDGG